MRQPAALESNRLVPEWGEVKADPIDRAVELLARGDVVGLPTETVYGLAADGLNPAAVSRVFSIKGRPPGHPLILHVQSPAELDVYGRAVPDAARRLAAEFWPGPLTLIVRRSALVPDAVTGGLDTVALRMPAHPLALEVLRRLGRPLAAPSANRFGKVSPTTREHVVADLGSDVPLVLDGGPCAIGIESTIVDLSREAPQLLRPGAITPEDIFARVGLLVFARDEGAPAAPGLLASHYAPQAPVFLVGQERIWDEARAWATQAPIGGRVGVVSQEPAAVDLPPGVTVEWLPGDSAALARGLYAALRRLDAAGCERILAVLPKAEGLGAALADRLSRAAHTPVEPLKL